MTNRIPSSLKWLIDKRARLDGEIKKTKASMARAQALIDELSEIETDLNAIDRAMQLHELQIDVANIDPIRSQYVRVEIPYGELTRALLLCLRLNDGIPVATNELVAFVRARFANLEATPQDHKRLHRSVRSRLKTLATKDVVVRYHSREGNEMGLWSLPKS